MKSRQEETRQLQDILYTLGRAQASGKNSVIPQLHDLAEATKSRAQIIIYSDFLDEPKSIGCNPSHA